MATRKTNKLNVYRLTYLAIMTAIVIVLQMLGSFIHLGTFSVSLVLVPIVLGAVVAGPLGGMWLGAVFGATVLILGDASTFLGIHFAGTIITVLAKGMLCGLCAGLIYRLLAKRNKYAAVATSAVICPIVNTGVFLIGSVVFFLGAISGWASDQGVGIIKYLFVFLVGGNFIFELLFNILLCPAIMRLIKLIPVKEIGYL